MFALLVTGNAADFMNEFHTTALRFRSFAYSLQVEDGQFVTFMALANTIKTSPRRSRSLENRLPQIHLNMSR